jgi:mRNA interferase RelE/StbE
MSYKLFLAKSADQALQKLPQETILHIEKKLIQLKTNPHLGKPLSGKLKPLWSLRISKYRAIYQIEEENISIYVIKIGPRKNIYD